jgi:hypothetical protein
MPPWLQPQARVLRHPPQRACSCPQRRPQKQFMRYRAQQGNQTLLRSSAPGARKAMEKAPCSSRYSLPPACGWPKDGPLFPHRCTCRPRWRGPWPRRVCKQTQHSHSQNEETLHEKVSESHPIRRSRNLQQQQPERQPEHRAGRDASATQTADREGSDRRQRPTFDRAT